MEVPPPCAHYGEVGGTQNMSGHSEVKDEVVSVHGMKAYRQTKHIAPLVWWVNEWVVDFTPRMLSPGEEPKVQTEE